jgi:hypothetical protein
MRILKRAKKGMIKNVTKVVDDGRISLLQVPSEHNLWLTKGKGVLGLIVLPVLDIGDGELSLSHAFGIIALCLSFIPLV